MLAGTSGAIASGQIRVADAGYLRLQCTPGTPAEVDGVFREFALHCIHTQAMRVMVRVDDGDRGAEKALRVALTTMVLAGLPDGFRVALVAVAGPIEALYRITQRDLVAANLDARLFDNEEAAARWLDGGA
jgi:hypothetical protein